MLVKPCSFVGLGTCQSIQMCREAESCRHASERKKSSRKEGKRTSVCA